MKLVAERTVAHKVWQLLPVAQARRGQRSLSSKLEEDEKKNGKPGEETKQCLRCVGLCLRLRTTPPRSCGTRWSVIAAIAPGDPWPAANGKRNVHMCWRGEDEG